MVLPAEPDIDVEVHADAAVPTSATARAVDLVRRLAAASGRQVRYAAVTLGVNDQWRGRRSSQAEIVIDAVGIYVRGFAAGITFGVGKALGVALGWPVFGIQWPLLAFAVIVAGLIAYKHRGNLARLRAGTEPRFERRPGTNGDSLQHQTDEADDEGGQTSLTSR